MISLWCAIHGWLHHSSIWWLYLNQYIATLCITLLRSESAWILAYYPPLRAVKS